MTIKLILNLKITLYQADVLTVAQHAISSVAQDCSGYESMGGGC